jgi:hypothetical protein
MVYSRVTHESTAIAVVIRAPRPKYHIETNRAGTNAITTPHIIF